MIEKMNLHYSFTNPASIHDEEALTALELAGRQGAKINEVVNDQNNLRTETENHLSEQDNRLDIFKSDTIPAEVAEEVQNHIRKGSFDKAIDEYVNELETRVDNLLGKMTEGSTTMDAEIIDARVGVDGSTHSTLGNAIRAQVDSLITPAYLRYYSFAHVDVSTIAPENGCVASVQFTPTEDSSLLAWYNPLKPGRNYTLIVETSGNIRVNRPFLGNEPSWNSADGVEMEITRNAIEGNTSYIDFKYTEGDTPPAYFNIRFEGGKNENCGVKVSVIPNLVNVTETPEIKSIDCPVLIPNFATLSPTNNYNYEPRVYVVNENYTPSANFAALVLWGTYEVGTTYRIRFKLSEKMGFVGMWLKTVANWSEGQGESATFIYQVNTLSGTEHEVYFKVIENAVNAGCLLFRFSAVATTEYNIQVDLSEMFYYDFDAPPVNDSKFIAFIGDSLTAQGYANYINSGDIDKQGYAVGGEGVGQIFKRTGIIPWRCESTTINPGANVLIHDGGNLFLQGMGNVNPVTIAGVSGILSRNGENLVFTPENLTESVLVYNPEIIPNLSTLSPVAYVLWAGTNNMYGTTEEILSAWKLFMKVHPNSVIVGLTRDPETKFLDMVHELDAMGEQEFGARYLAVHDWLVNYGLPYNGLTATSADSAAIAAGKIPSSLLSDAIHFNEYGKKAVAHLVEERLKKLGVL